jgi:hypothetical protein
LPGLLPFFNRPRPGNRAAWGLLGISASPPTLAAPGLDATTTHYSLPASGYGDGLVDDTDRLSAASANTIERQHPVLERRHGACHGIG